MVNSRYRVSALQLDKLRSTHTLLQMRGKKLVQPSRPNWATNLRSWILKRRFSRNNPATIFKTTKPRPIARASGHKIGWRPFWKLLLTKLSEMKTSRRSKKWPTPRATSAKSSTLKASYLLLSPSPLCTPANSKHHLRSLNAAFTMCRLWPGVS